MPNDAKTEQELTILIASLDPKLDPKTYVFCSQPKAQYGELAELNPIACILESEGLTLILEDRQADRNGLSYDGHFRRITLSVQSSLEAVGLTAVISQTFADNDIPANVVAGTYHDHLFIPERFTRQAMTVLAGLQSEAFASVNKRD